MNIYVFTDTNTNKASIVHAKSLDEAWEKYILRYLPIVAAEEPLSGIRRDLEHDVIVNSDVDNII